MADALCALCDEWFDPYGDRAIIHLHPEPQSGTPRDEWIASGLPYDRWVAETEAGRAWDQRATRGRQAELSRERIAELRDLLHGGGRPSRQAREDLLVALDAYEAQRPRPASEVPEAPGLVLVRHDSAPGRYQPAWYEPRASPPKRWLWESRNWIDPSEILAWLPLPPAPEERDDG